MSEIPSLLLELNITLAAAVLIVLTLRKPARRIVGPRAAYGLWSAVPMTLVAVCLPRVVVGPVSTVSEPSFGPWLVGVWCIGAVASAGLMVASQLRFAALARRGLAGPAVMGVIVPRLVMPADSATRWSPEERALILAHEHAHLERADLRVNAGVAMLQCLFWCNPLAHLAVHCLRFDQELACDAKVLAVRPGQRRLYAEALLKAAPTPATPLGCGWRDGTARGLEVRLASLRLHRHAPDPVAVACVASFALAIAVAAWALQPASTEGGPESLPKVLNLRLSPPAAGANSIS